MEKRVLIDNKVVPVSDTKVTFGLKSLKRPTPKIANHIFRYVLYISALCSIILDIFPEIPAPVKMAVGLYSAKAVALVHAITRLSGRKEIS